MTKPRKDMMVVEKRNGELVIAKKSEFYRPKRQQAVAVIPPRQEVTLMPPDTSSINPGRLLVEVALAALIRGHRNFTITLTHTRERSRDW